ncbi:MAG: peptide ABC transporter substrate-binding protein [Opitutaceae bacterium]|jgi:oligopeptide transport system substrate-binding protein|nr:peptide ABC transporter substrate-binding protein [Opitutaceae bacterium]
MTPAPLRKLPPLLLAILAALLPAACSRPANVETGNATRTLHRGIGPEPSSLDPHLATQAGDYAVLSALFEGLVAEDPVDLHPVPGAAESWSVSPDGLVWIFRIRGNARWSNGAPLAAADFAASWRRVLSPALASENAGLLFVLKNAAAYHRGELADFSRVGVAAPDARTLRVTLEHPVPWFPRLLQHWAWWPVHLPSIARNGPVDSRANNWAVPATLVCNGPFTLKQHRPGQRVIVEKNPLHWDAPSVRLDAIHFHPIADLHAEHRAYLSGQLHLTEGIPPAKIPASRRERPAELRTDPLLGVYFYRVNTADPRLSNRLFRRALNLAVPRAAITGKLLRAGERPASAFVPADLPGHKPPPGVATDYALARALLAESGVPAGTPVEILYNTSDNHRAIAEVIQETWRRELRLDVTLRNMENKSVLEARAAGAYQLLRSSWIADYLDPMSFLEVFRGDSPNNHTGWRDPAYDALLDRAARETDPAARDRLYQEAEQLLLAASPVLPIHTHVHAYLKHPAVRGWHPTLLDHHPYKAVSLDPEK